jgi:hypothetical protein
MSPIACRSEIALSGKAVLYGEIAFGTVSGGTKATSPLVITFNANATPAAVQTLVRNLVFQNASASLVTLPLAVTLSFTDGDGGAGAVATAAINIGA